MHIQDPLFGMYELASQTKEKSWVGIHFVHWELIASLLFANCQNLMRVTGCWRAGIIRVYCEGEVKLIINMNFMVTFQAVPFTLDPQ